MAFLKPAGTLTVVVMYGRYRKWKGFEVAKFTNAADSFPASGGRPRPDQLPPPTIGSIFTSSM